jgi:hypothetical protein
MELESSSPYPQVLRLRDTSSRNAPPRDPYGKVVYLRIVLSPEEASLHGYFLTYVFYGEGLLPPRPTPKLEDHPSSAVRGCLFNIFTDTVHLGGRSSIRNLRTRHAVMTGTHIHGILEDYYTKIWNGTYVNSEKATHTKTLIPSTFHRLNLPLWPNSFLTQLLTNHGCFRSYLYKMGKVPTSLCDCPKSATSYQTAACSQKSDQQHFKTSPSPR